MVTLLRRARRFGGRSRTVRVDRARMIDVRRRYSCPSRSLKTRLNSSKSSSIFLRAASTSLGLSKISSISSGEALRRTYCSWTISSRGTMSPRRWMMYSRTSSSRSELWVRLKILSQKDCLFSLMFPPLASMAGRYNNRSKIQKARSQCLVCGFSSLGSRIPKVRARARLSPPAIPGSFASVSSL